MKPTRQSTNKYIRIQFEDVGELTNHLKEVAKELYSPMPHYNEMEWNKLCQKHGVCGDSKQDWS